MRNLDKLDATIVRRLAALNGLDLSIERAADLVAPLQTILDADAQIRALGLGTLSTVGLPWGEAPDEAD